MVRRQEGLRVNYQRGGGGKGRGRRKIHSPTKDDSFLAKLNISQG